MGMDLSQEFPAEAMAEGDVYIMNDPYDGGSHLPDIVIVLPILFNGGFTRPVAAGNVGKQR